MEDIDENVIKGVQSIKENMLKSPGANSWKASKYRRWTRQLIIIRAVDRTGAEAAELEEVTEIVILMYIKLNRESKISRIPLPRLNRTIESFQILKFLTASDFDAPAAAEVAVESNRLISAIHKREYFEISRCK